MAAQLLLVNPRRKRKARRARAKNPKRRRVVARRRNPAKHRRAVGYVVGSGKVRRRKLNPRRKVHRAKRRHNPRMLSMGGIMGQLVPAAIGGAGAVGLDIALSYLPAATPEFLRTGLGNKALKIAGALALGMVAGKVLGRDKGRAVTAGALTVVAYGIIRDVVKQVAPNVALAGTDYQDVAYNPAPMLQGVGAYMDNSFQAAQMGAYIQNDGM